MSAQDRQVELIVETLDAMRKVLRALAERTITEADVRRIVREELAALSRREAPR